MPFLNLFLIIQARMTSTRLPGKVMLPLCGKTVLEVMIERFHHFKENIIIATTNDGTEEPIVKLCKKLHVNYYRGDTQNVLSRYYEAAVAFGANDNDIIVRCTSDCPLIDQDIILKCIDYYAKGNYDYVSNCLKRTYPRGLDCEVFNFQALTAAFRNALLESEKEHVTPYIDNTHSDRFKIGHITDKNNNSKYRLTLDEEEDYRAIQEVYNKFNNQVNFSYAELINLLEKNPYIYEINSHVEQKKYSL